MLSGNFPIGFIDSDRKVAIVEGNHAQGSFRISFFIDKEVETGLLNFS